MYQGIFDTEGFPAEAINTIVDQLRSFASEVTRVAREVGTDRSSTRRSGHRAERGWPLEGPHRRRAPVGFAP
jgi:hypothetical protein